MIPKSSMETFNLASDQVDAIVKNVYKNIHLSSHNAVYKFIDEYTKVILRDVNGK